VLSKQGNNTIPLVYNAAVKVPKSFKPHIEFKIEGVETEKLLQ